MRTESEKRHFAIRFAEALRAINNINHAEKLEKSFHAFVCEAWEVFDPAAFVDNWHLKDLCMHMEQVAKGNIRRFLINVPPRTAKSNIISVCYPAWVWAQREIGPQSGPSVSFFYASYAEALALEHSLKCRRLVESKWYQKYWGRRFKLVSDRNTKGHFENDKGGYRMASSVDARATGWGAMCVFADDPHLVKEAESEDVRTGVVRWWAETIPSRLNDRKTGALGVVMQRVHEGDVAGDILLKDSELRRKNLPADYVHFCVPMCYVPVHHVNAWDQGRIRTFIGDEIESVPEEAVFWRDRRVEEGELLWAVRYPSSEVAKLEHELGPYAFCTPGESPVLMGDLSSRPISEIREGDIVVGFNRGDGNKRARLKPVRVLAISRSEQPVFKLMMDSGHIVRCTADHKWYTGRDDVSHVLYKPAKIGSPLKRVCPPCLEVLDSEKAFRTAGWVAGFFDGEGSVSLMNRRDEKAAILISFHQSSEQNLPLCQRLEESLCFLGFNYGVHERDPRLQKGQEHWQKRRYYYIKADAGNGFTKGGPSKRSSKLIVAQRFLHTVQPTKWRSRIIDAVTNGKMDTTTERVVSIEPDGVETVYGLTTETGNYVVWGLASSNSGQYQQDPVPRGGGIIKKDWWQLWDDDAAKEHGASPGTYPPFEYLLASLDTAYTEKEENDPSALSIWGMWRDKNGNPQVMLVICWAERLQIHNLVLRVGDTCKKFKVDKLLIEDKAAGHSVSQELHRLFGVFDFAIDLVNPRSGFIKSPDKVARLQTVAHLFAEGIVWAPDKTWADEMINQVAAIPRSVHDDLCDSMTQSLIYLRRNNWIQRKEELTLQVEDELKYRPRLQPLYEV